jgi:hypothetical protein
MTAIKKLFEIDYVASTGEIYGCVIDAHLDDYLLTYSAYGISELEDLKIQLIKRIDAAILQTGAHQ